MSKSAYSVVQFKELDAGSRIIEGVATTPRVDRDGDIVVSKGAKYKLPIPLLLDHNHIQAIGAVEAVTVGAADIKFRARIRTIDTPGPLKQLVDDAWQMVRAGLRRGVSIGFRALQQEAMNTGGLIFKEWEWLELSLVTLPSNVDAVFSAKSFDQQIAALAEAERSRCATRVVKLGSTERATDSRSPYDRLRARGLDEESVMDWHRSRKGEA